MAGKLLIDAQELAAMIMSGECVVFDCRFDLQHPSVGRNSWLASHIPGAVYAHLDENLSGRITVRSGRHPLPAARSFASFLARSGWCEGVQAVAYDAQGGAFAARFWWLMKYFGLGGAVLLDGGIAAWMTATLPMESGEVSPARNVMPVLAPRHELALKTRDVVRELENGSIRLVDARDEHRFEGRSEPIDPVAGHIPGAMNHPMSQNLDVDRHFKQPAELKSGFRHVTARAEPADIVHMCGSGVTACQNIFAMELAGIEDTRLYSGSWSEWIKNPARPVALGLE
jgi:thiosulfate/3-mercaptopyruvate sulfurtransferase